MPEDAALPFLTRLWFAWLCFFKVLFDGRFAASVWQVKEHPALAGPPRALPAEAPPRAPLDGATNATSTTSALQLLALLQREGRFVDFLAARHRFVP